MVDKLTPKQAQVLTIFVWILMFMISVTIVFQYTLIADQNTKITTLQKCVSDLPDKYVTKERHTSDLQSIERMLDRMDRLLTDIWRRGNVNHESKSGSSAPY